MTLAELRYLVAVADLSHFGRAAERCHVHQSTIKYRLRRIHELLGCDLADAEVRFDLMLALKILRLLRAADADPNKQMVLQPA